MTSLSKETAELAASTTRFHETRFCLSPFCIKTVSALTDKNSKGSCAMLPALCFFSSVSLYSGLGF